MERREIFDGLFLGNPIRDGYATIDKRYVWSNANPAGGRDGDGNPLTYSHDAIFEMADITRINTLFQHHETIATLRLYRLSMMQPTWTKRTMFKISIALRLFR